MKIFIDTNVFLDLILKREGFKEAVTILNGCSKNNYEGVVADITLLNIDYIASKQTKDIRTFLGVVNKTCKIIGVNNTLFSLALELDNKDLEDSVQYVCAKSYHCDFIITNDQRFYEGEIKVISSKKFVNEYA
jgi:predicted nucleic acid-binding protein